MPIADSVGVFQSSAQPTRRRRGGAGVEEAGHAVRQHWNQGAEIHQPHPTLCIGEYDDSGSFNRLAVRSPLPALPYRPLRFATGR